MTKALSSAMDIIDSRDVIKRIAELESDREDLKDEHEGKRKDLEVSLAALLLDETPKVLEQLKEAAEEHLEALNRLIDWDDDEGAELTALQALEEQGKGYGDWAHGETLIRHSYFKEYAQQLADDTGAVNSGAGWPNNCIDWEEASEQLLMDYTSIDFDGTDFWMRT